MALYVVSLYEGPSEEARTIFQQMKENKTPVIVVFTKSDLVSEVRRESVKQSILELAASFQVPICLFPHLNSSVVDTLTVSCVTNEGIEQLQQRLVELGQMRQPSVPIDCPAEATVLDSLVIPSQGIVFRALVQQGYLSLRSNFICGMYTGRVRNLIDLHSNPVQKAMPGMVVNVLGARKLPAFLRKKPQLLPAGDTLFVRTPEEIKAIWEQRLGEFSFRASAEEEDGNESNGSNESSESSESNESNQGRELDSAKQQSSPLELESAEQRSVLPNRHVEIIDGEEYVEVKSQSVIAVADNANSMAILLDQLNAKPNMNIVRTRVGQITDKEIRLCRESDVKLVSFNVALPPKTVLSEKKFIYSRLMNELIDKLNVVFGKKEE